MIGLSGQKLLLPFYHLVSDDVPLHLKYLYAPRSIETFKSDLDFFLKHYQPVGLNELIQMKRAGGRVKEKCFHLTFDDGLSEFNDIVAPILREKGIPATVFLNDDFIDNKQLFYRFKESILLEHLFAYGLLDISYADRKTLDEIANEYNINFDDYLEKEQPYLTSAQINKLKDEGFTFGAHSMDHPLYNQISIEEQLNQTIKSIDSISSRFNLDYRVFSFPFTDDGVSKQFFDQIADHVDLTFGSAGLKKDSAANHLHRIPMEEEDTGASIIKSAYFYYLLKGFAGKNKIFRR